MLLRFPDVDAVLRALTSGVIPEAMASAPAEVARDADGALWISAAGRSTNALAQAVAGVGGELVKRSALPASAHRILTWAEFIPLVAHDAAAADLAHRAVLFELATTEQLTALVTELLRLGSHRQSVRRLTSKQGERILLRVIGPAYFTLLKAHPATREADSPRAYLEQAPRVWIELGYQHPLGDRLQAPEDRLLLARSPTDWTALPEGPFEDLERVTTFAVPSPPVEGRDEPLTEPIRVPVQLVPSTATEPAELWVIRGGLDAVDAFVAEADDSLLERLSFAVAETKGERRVVLRARPGRGAPPVLALDALELRSYLKIPHLFVPCSTRLHPPLRRDAVRRLLAEDPDRVTWLEPDAAGGFHTFTLPDSAFRSLSDWVEYVLDSAQETLNSWTQSHTFEFEAWITADEEPMLRQPAERQSIQAVDNTQTTQHQHESADPPPGSTAAPASDSTPPTIVAATASAPTTEPPTSRPEQPATADQLAQLRTLEQQFVDRNLPLDDARALDRWRKMAVLHAAVGNRPEASTCWLFALWESQSPPPGWWNEWQRVADDPLHIAAELAIPDQQSHATSARLPQLRSLLEASEEVLPIRAAWLAWLGLVNRTGGDVLALARARDRILERLHRSGLNAPHELPAFLRSTRAASDERAARLRVRCLELHNRAATWIARETAASPSLRTAKTAAYADLIAAWGLARLGFLDESAALAATPLRELNAGDPVHTWLASAFTVRLDNARRGAPAGPLPAALLSQLDEPALRTARTGPAPRYLIDRLRRQSQILEPVGDVDAYRRAAGAGSDDITRGIEHLCDVSDTPDLRQQADRFLARIAAPGVPAPSRAAVQRAVLDVAPRLGEAFARELLPRVTVTLDEPGDPLDQIVLLERSLFVASHFDLHEFAVPLANRLIERLARQLPADRNPADVERVAALVGRSVQGLRRLGMHDVVRGMLDQLDAMAQTTGKPPSPGPRGAHEQHASILALRLPLVPAWIAFDEPQRAQPLIEEAEQLLAANATASRTDAMHAAWTVVLAKSLITALGALDLDEAAPRLDRLFDSLRHVHVPSQADSHYSSSMLAIIEAAITRLISDDQTVDATTRRRLDESEYLIRRRIHRDLREALK